VLKVQAYADGQLTAAEAAEVSRQLGHDSRDRLLHDELRSLKTLLRQNELARPVPETREFYWSQIRRGIESLPREEGPKGIVWWLRWLAPVGATVLVCWLWFSPLEEPPASAARFLVGHEIETPMEETTSFAFRSESAAMSVVWVETRGLHNLASVD
jgi:anti-sigma factor RsiW